MTTVIAGILLWLSLVAIVLFFMILFDDLKERIDRRVDEDKWQNSEIERLRERVSKIEKEE